MDDADIASQRILADEAARAADHRARMAARPAESAKICADCGDPIPADRRRLAKGCTLCFDCQNDFDDINRRRM